MGPAVAKTVGVGSPQESAGVLANTRECARKKANRERSTFMYWWPERPLNLVCFPGPVQFQTRNQTRVPQSSAQAVPDSPATAVLVKRAAFDQRPEMLLQRIAAGPG